ncbi:hypothetical protein MKZ38_001901 [Zalerion maritima]|uniref:CHY-type domain-containing protein n=1 Tax=Zalerion maritima TaxID=339359 RepID=A0AAD5RQN3_9PEZI|nr:hypothetical protein MKZ38_001901 [Zalerion maritima]
MISANSPPGGKDRRPSQVVTSVPESRVVSRPIPEEQTRDPRGFELNQLRRRYNPQESPFPHNGILFTFKFSPSDPDFPFDLDYLRCALSVPGTYPDYDIEGPPRLKVQNASMPRGFAINVENGWERIAQERKGITLAQMVRVLDNQLESLLSERMADTVKIVQFKDMRHLDKKEREGSASGVDQGQEEEGGGDFEGKEEIQEKIKPKPRLLPPLPREVYTRDQINEAKVRRAAETRQLETRMGRSAGYRREADGVVYTLPFEVRGRVPLPDGLKGVSKMHLIIPLLYPLQTLRVQLADATNGVFAEKVEDLFSERIQTLPKMNLIGLVNWLAGNLGFLAKEALDREAKLETERVEQELARKVAEESGKGKEKAKEGTEDGNTDGDGKSHIKVIPRPPEWTFGYRSAESDSEDYSDDSEYDNEGDENFRPEDKFEGFGTSKGKEDMNAERGTALSFPGLSLKEVELLGISSLAIRIRCQRCRTINDVKDLQHGLEKSVGCSKCSLELTVRFRQQLMHENSSRAGFVDAVGCSVVDMSPSIFIPVCAQCSKDCPPITCIKGDTVNNICRSCHTRFRISLPEFKLSVLTVPLSSSYSTSHNRQSEKFTSSLGSWQPGQQLPNRGTCEHYRRSFRWFRFNCCKKVYPCDHCHDEAKEQDHFHEWADRMVCGFCGREGRYAPNACGFCGRTVIGGGGGGKGFWEGGRGMREREKMNRKERRKYKRVGKGGMERERVVRRGGV